MSTEIINGENSGRHIVDGPLTVAASTQAVPGLIRNTIDARIVKVRPSSTPIDQISRSAGARPVRSMTVEYYSVDPKKQSATLAEPVAKGVGKRRADGIFTHIFKTADDIIFEPSETLIVPSHKVAGDQPLVVYVLNRTADGLEVMVVNHGSPQEPKPIESIPAGTEIVRMGRAATELDVQTPQFQALPTKSTNNCQIFKMQVEESTFHKIANKEVGWNFSDQEEVAIMDMRMGMEKNFIFGERACLLDPVKQEYVYLTGGIWNQAPRKIEVTLDDFSEQTLIDIAHDAFTRNCGSKRKIFVCGSELMRRISRIECQRVRRSNDAKVKWGLVFNELVTNFGSLYFIHSEIFDQCGHAEDGLVIDPDYLTKYVHVPFRTDKLDLRSSGTRNTSAVVLTEASCVVLRYPETHLRVIGVQVESSADKQS